MNINELNAQEDETSDETPKDLQDPNLPKSWKYAQSYLKDLIIGDTSQGVRTSVDLHDFDDPKTLSELILYLTMCLKCFEVKYLLKIYT